MNRYSSKFQKGLNLMELLIALALGLVITVAMISLFINSKQSYRMNDNISRLQENSRFAVQFLTRDLRMADWRTCVTDDHLENALTVGTGKTINGVATDTVTIQWQTNDCTGTSTVQSTVYSIDSGASGEPSLFRSIDGATAVELVEGISDLQFRLGEDSDGDYAPNRYVEPGSVSSNEDIVAVRFAVTASTMGVNFTPTGNDIVRTFDSVVTLRNRIP